MNNSIKFIITIFSFIILPVSVYAESDCKGNYELGLATNLTLLSEGGSSVAYTSDSAGCRVMFEYWNHPESSSGLVPLDSNNTSSISRKVSRGYRMYIDNYYSGDNMGWYSGIGLGQFRSILYSNNNETDIGYWSGELFLRGGYKYRLMKYISLDPQINVGSERILGGAPSLGSADIKSSALYVNFSLMFNLSVSL